MVLCGCLCRVFADGSLGGERYETHIYDRQYNQYA